MSAKDDERLYGQDDAPADGEAAAEQDTHSPSKLNDAQKRAVVRDQKLVETAQAMLSTEAGRALLGWIMFDLCGFTASTVSASPSADGLHASNLFRSGQRDVALRLNQMLRRADKSGYVVLLKEHIDQM